MCTLFTHIIVFGVRNILFSTNHKDFGTLHFVFDVGIVGTFLRILIRKEPVTRILNWR
jgi:hypothetical protein